MISIIFIDLVRQFPANILDVLGKSIRQSTIASLLAWVDIVSAPIARANIAMTTIWLVYAYQRSTEQIAELLRG